MPVLVQRKSPLLINDLSNDRNLRGWRTCQATAGGPAAAAGQVLGCLFALDKITGDFDSQDSKLLNSIANESAIYLENASCLKICMD